MRCHLRRRATAALLVAASAAGLLSGCGGQSSAARLRSRLLSVSDLPVGWSAAATGNSSRTRLTGTPCLAGLAEHPQGWRYQTAAFVEGKSIPNLGEVVATGARVGQAWSRVDRALAGCRSATLVLYGTKVTATIHRVAFPPIGRSSSAYAWTFTLAGIRIGFDLVLFRTGHYAGYLSYADLGQPPTDTVKAFALAAVAKAQHGITAAVPDSVSIASAPVRTAHTRLGPIAYRAIGTGPSLLLITGYGGTMEAWPPGFVDALAQHRHVVTFDNAGVGKTGGLPAPLTVDAMADQTSALIDTLGLGRTDVLGWSMGSMIAQALAVRHPNQVRRLVLCASFPGNGTAVPPSRTELDAFESGNPKQVMAALFPSDQTAAQNTYLAAISSYPSVPAVPNDLLAGQKRAIDGWWSAGDPSGTKANVIVAPTLVADGTVDRLDPAANSHILANLIRGARLELYPDAGHAFLFQDQPSLLALIEAFLGSRRAGAS